MKRSESHLKHDDQDLYSDPLDEIRDRNFRVLMLHFVFQCLKDNVSNSFTQEAWEMITYFRRMKEVAPGYDFSNLVEDFNYDYREPESYLVDAVYYYLSYLMRPE